MATKTRSTQTNAQPAAAMRACIYVPMQTHRRAKVFCAVEGLSLGEYVAAVINADLTERRRQTETR